MINPASFAKRGVVVTVERAFLLVYGGWAILSKRVYTMDDGGASSKMLWYLVQLKPNGHQIAERNLVRQGFCVFNPMEDKTLRKNGRFS